MFLLDCLSIFNLRWCHRSYVRAFAWYSWYTIVTAKTIIITKTNFLQRWPWNLSRSFNATLIHYLIGNPIKEMKQYNFPRDFSGRKFSEYYYERHLGNGEKYHKECLLYSVYKNAVYCFCCKLFESKHKNKFCERVRDWQHLVLYCSRL